MTPDPSITSLLDALVAEGQKFLKARKPAIKPPGEKTSLKPSSKKAPLTTDEVNQRLEAIRAAKLEAMKSLSEGTLPGGWERETILMQEVTCSCSWCGSRVRALAPPAVYLVCHQTRHPETKHMRPLRDHAEVTYYISAVGLPVRIERSDTTIPACPACIGDLRP